MKKDLHPIPENEIKHHTFQGIVGKSAEIKKVIREIKTLASKKGIVLITGETGVGKGLVANALWEVGNRKSKPYITFNCGQLNEDPPRSEFFGHEPGAFTSADSRHLGIFEQANGGTLFLDEIMEMPPNIQKSFLTILDGTPFRRMNGTEDITLDIRFIAATNLDLAEAYREGKVRDDFFYRLSQFDIEVPPLRKRNEDIPLLVHAFIYDLSCEHGKTIIGIEQDALDFLNAKDWPGNVRQLWGVINRAVTFAETDRLEIEGIEEAHKRLDRLEIEGIEETHKRSDPLSASRSTQDASLSTPSSLWGEAFKELLKINERSIDTFAALIEGIDKKDGLRISHLNGNMPYYKTSDGADRQYVSSEVLRAMYKDIIKPILEKNPALLKDSDSDEVQNNFNNTVLKQLRSVLLHKNPQLKKANDAIKNENAMQSPPSVP